MKNGVRPREGILALFSAIQGHDVTTLVYLVSERPSLLNATDSKRRTPLEVAIESKQSETVQILLKSGAHAASTTSTGFTPLQLATLKSTKPIIDLLLAHGADLSANRSQPGIHSKNCLALAALRSFARIDVARALLSHAAASADPDDLASVLNTQDSTGSTPLHDHLLRPPPTSDYLDFLADLVRCGAYLNAQTVAGTTPLHVAAHAGNWNAVYLLVTAGARPDVPNADGRAPAVVARRLGHVRIAKFLERKSGQLSSSISGVCLYEAGASACRDDVAALLSAGARVNMTCRGRRTMLHGAAAANCVDMIRYLIHLGADITAVDAAGRGPLETAAQNHSWNAVRIFVAEYGVAPSRETAFCAAQVGRLDIVLSFGDEVCVESVLFGGAKGGHVDVVEFALDRGADPSAVNEDSLRALDLAVAGGHFDVAQLLLQQGVSANQPTGFENLYETTLEFVVRTRGDRDVTQKAVFLVECAGARCPDIADTTAKRVWPSNLWKLIVENGEVGRSVKSLQFHCRLAIWFMLGEKAEKLMNKLPLPKTLKAYLLCKDLG